MRADHFERVVTGNAFQSFECSWLRRAQAWLAELVRRLLREPV